MSLLEEIDEEIHLLIEDELKDIKVNLNNLELEQLLSNEFDKLSCTLEIHAGAGGTEACDWASMLYRMYMRYSNNQGYKVEEISKQDGDDAGIKSVTLSINGINAYGYLKNEIGVHRLVRLSPFDSANKRHTSFASVEVIPSFDNDKIDIEVNESDLKVDVYRSGGAGGQHVNTTDSAVRMTHLPSKIVVTCQSERSQIKNREKALQLLKNKLYTMEIERRQANIDNLKTGQKEINFGSQIRSYVMCPYTMVKDHRTNYEEVNVDNVLDGNIEQFIYENLKESKKNVV